MLTIEKDFTVSCPDLALLGIPQEQLLFFDIETTGFSGEYASVYLIGCIYPEKDSWHMVQFFADSADAEPELLSAFGGLLSGRRVLVHFNGDRFDIPFLQKRCAAHGVPDLFSASGSVDILKKIRPWKKPLNLPDLRQKTVETFLGIAREDRFSGGELIPIYERWLHVRDRALLSLLLLHNEEDLLGMPNLLPMLRYPAFFGGSFRFLSEEACEDAVALTWVSETCLPVPVLMQAPAGTIRAEASSLRMDVPLYCGELRHFYADYRNYYYLPGEDSAIHRSVGEFVDKSLRKKATARTCYTRAAGRFLPEPSEIFPMTLRQDYASKQFYTPYREGMFSDDALSGRYLREVLAGCI